jgi:hypothetical protein
MGVLPNWRSGVRLLVNLIWKTESIIVNFRFRNAG